jgi:hypothetical protein
VPEDAKGRVTRSVLNRINSKSPGSNRGLRSGDQLRWLHISREEQQRGAKEEAGLGWIRYEAPDTLHLTCLYVHSSSTLTTNYCCWRSLVVMGWLPNPLLITIAVIEGVWYVGSQRSLAEVLSLLFLNG